MFGSIDFETYYDAEYSVQEMGAYRYCADSRFEAYCVSFSREDGVKYAGPPSGFDWNLVRDCVVFMHNATFDCRVLSALQRQHIAPKDLDLEIHDTSDMGAYWQSKRNLAACSQNFLGKTMSKATRLDMKGKHWSQVKGTDLGKQLLEYAQQDADATLELGMLLYPKWPENERKVSKISREAGYRGMPLDVEYLEYSKRHLDTLIHTYLADVPWYPEKPLLSIPAMRAEARKNGMWFPASTNKEDPMAQKWAAEYAEKYTWIMATRNYRSVNGISKRIHNLWDGRDGDYFPFELLYCGAVATGRWSGGGVRYDDREDEEGTEGNKFNVQNMPRDPMFGVRVRYCFKAPPGKLFYVADYSQIEYRLLLWRVRDTGKLDRIRSGFHPYKAFAKEHLGAPDNPTGDDPKYLAAKACILGGGYQGSEKAIQRSGRKFNMDIPTPEAIRLKNLYRDLHPLVVQHWAKHQMYLQLSVNAKDPSHEIELPSGRAIRFFNPHQDGLNQWGKPQIVAQRVMGGEFSGVYGGKITNGEIQGTGRDVIRDGWVTSVEAGFDAPLTVHDEYVILGPDCDEKGKKAYCQEIRNVLKTASPWAEGCPLDVGIAVSDHYEK